MAALLVVLAYLCGSVPWGLVLAHRAGVDPRREGSGNIGATNVARTAGAGLGAATLALDAAKGALPVVLARLLGSSAPVAAIVALAAVLGHVFPPWLRFAGGKGVATALGALAPIVPGALAGAVAVFGLVLGLTSRVAAASLAGAAAAAVLSLAIGYPGPAAAVTWVIAALIFVRHRENIRRLLAGTEPPLHIRTGP